MIIITQNYYFLSVLCDIMNIEETATKITTMEIRGAGKIARAAASALKKYAKELKETDPKKFIIALTQAKDRLFNTRPTAVSLGNALSAVLAGAKGDSVDEIREGVIAAADMFIKSSKTAIKTISDTCAGLIHNGDTIITHCNSTVAVQSIIKAHSDGTEIRVFAPETRPWRQGFITAQTLADAGVDVTLIVDSAVRFFMPETNIVIVGADTIMGNGSVVNKIGTSQIALCAHEHNVPVIVCAETYKFSKSVGKDDTIIIEERDSTEIVGPGKLTGVKIRNPVFDITPPKYITAIITEIGKISPHETSNIIQKMLRE